MEQPPVGRGRTGGDDPRTGLPGRDPVRRKPVEHELEHHVAAVQDQAAGHVHAHVSRRFHESLALLDHVGIGRGPEDVQHPGLFGQFRKHGHQRVLFDEVHRRGDQVMEQGPLLPSHLPGSAGQPEDPDALAHLHVGLHRVLGQGRVPRVLRARVRPAVDPGVEPAIPGPVVLRRRVGSVESRGVRLPGVEVSGVCRGGGPSAASQDQRGDREGSPGPSTKRGGAMQGGSPRRSGRF
jgi:hypothetical protein